MKKTIIKGVYLIIIFLVALFSVSAVMNKGNTDMTMEMGILWGKSGNGVVIVRSVYLRILF